jgi:hypothetical protein
MADETPQPDLHEMESDSGSEGTDDDLKWSTDLTAYCDLLRSYGRGARLACMARPVARSAPEVRLVGTFHMEARKELWVAWDKDQDSTTHATLTAFPCKDWEYAACMVEPPMRTMTVPIEEEQPRSPPRKRAPPKTSEAEPPRTQGPRQERPEDSTQAHLVSLLNTVLQQNQALIAAQPAFGAAANKAAVDLVANHGGRPCYTIVEGLRVPVAVDAPYTALYPHFFMVPDSPTSGETIARWRATFEELKSHLGVSFHTTALRDEYDLARDTILELAAGRNLPTTKAGLRVLWWQMFQLVKALMTARAGAPAADTAVKKLRGLWYLDGKYELDALLRADPATAAGGAERATESTSLQAVVETFQRTVTQAVAQLKPQARHRHFRNHRRGGDRRSDGGGGNNHQQKPKAPQA